MAGLAVRNVRYVEASQAPTRSNYPQVGGAPLISLPEPGLQHRLGIHTLLQSSLLTTIHQASDSGPTVRVYGISLET